jgi:arylsulfatase
MLQHFEDWGSPKTYPHFAAGWAIAMDAPFSWTKQIASDFGGVRNGMVIHYPKGIHAKGEIRTQFCHVIDIAPTIYELAQIPAPRVVDGIEQDPIEGTSLVYSFNDPVASERHTLQYFEIYGNRAIYDSGWIARTIHRAPWMINPPQTLQNDKWELYNTCEDYSLSCDLSQKYPEKLKTLQDLFMSEAGKYHVLPLDDRTVERFNATNVGRPTIMEGRTAVDYAEGMKGMGNDIFINLRNTSYTITADILVDNNGNGVVVCQGGRFGGFSFFIKDGSPSFTYNYLGMNQYNLVSPQPLDPGKHTLEYSFSYDGGGPGKGGTGTILVDGIKRAESRIEKTEPNVFSYDDLADVGTDEGTPVTNYGSSPIFTGKIYNVHIEVTGLKNANQ